MMNRGIMNRQMFRQGGAAFPDLSGDGQVTQRDILMGRGVLPKPCLLYTSPSPRD